MSADVQGTPVGQPTDEEPTTDEVIADLMERIGDLEWQLDLDDTDDPSGVDVAISAAADLALIYSHLGDIQARDRMLDRLNKLVGTHRTRGRTTLMQRVYAQLAAHPGHVSAA